MLLDANALMMPAQFQIDIFEEIRNLVGSFEPVILSTVLHELEGLTRANGRHGAAARLGLALAAQCTVADSRELGSGSVDAQVIEYAAQTHCMVVTNDRRIRDALYARGIGVISMRNQKRLEIMRS